MPQHTIPIYSPEGVLGDIPAEDLAPALQSGYTISPPPPQPKMQTSAAPTIVRGALNVLPVAGGMAGGIVGAGAGGLGALAGGGLGAAGGAQAKQMLENLILQSGPEPTSQQGLTETALAFGLGMAAEAPAALALGMGNKLIANMTLRAKAAGETGDVLEGLKLANPLKFSREGLKDSILKAEQVIGNRFGAILRANSRKTINSDLFINDAERRAVDLVARRPELKGVLPAVRRAIASASEAAGITRGSQTTPQQIWNFQKQLQKVFSTEPTAATAATSAQVNQILRQTYTSAGNLLRLRVPEAGTELANLTNLYAAQAGLQRGFGRLGALTVSAAANPRATAAVSPALAVAGGAAGIKAGGAIERIVGGAELRRTLP